MEQLQAVDFGSWAVLILGCGLLLGVMLILFFGIQILGTVLGIFGQVLGLFTGVVAGGPEAWCGCIVFIFGCGLCSGLAFFVVQLTQTCGGADAVNFCRLLGY